MSEDYVREKLWAAVDVLATGTGVIQDRLVSAYMSGLFTLRPEDFVDEESRVQFSAMNDLFTSLPAEADEGTTIATVSKMSDDQAAKLARAIFDLDGHYRPLWYFVGRSILDDPPPP